MQTIDQPATTDPGAAPGESLLEAFHQYQCALVGYTRQITGDLDLARDVVQEAFLRLARERPQPSPDRLAPWLYTVCRNRALDVLRKERRMEPLETTQLELVVDQGHDPAAAAESRDEERVIMGFVEGLPANQREVVHLKFADGLSYREISELTGLSVGNVGFLLHNALNQLRRRIARQLPQP
ncbi:MAG: RNA polymerase sigma factor [Verrucomicrobiales bacterium]|nr:RNA polymerase sigma factor [Verrucomicrobiales bacterium]